MIAAIEKAETVLTDGACKYCAEIEFVFDAVSKEVLKVVDEIKCPELEASAEKVLKMIGLGLKALCSENTTSASPVTTTTAGPATTTASPATTTNAANSWDDP